MDKPYKNSGLFSDHYLRDKLPSFEVWQVDPSELTNTYDKIKALYEAKKNELPNLSESALEERYIRPILRALGHVYEVQPTLTSTAEGMKKPDYAFFANEDARTEAEKLSGKEEFFKSSLAIGEAKQWGRPLDKKLKTVKDPFEMQNPSLQMSRYLWLTGVKWGILTDGHFWRLYERETSKGIDIYYEVDLPELLECGTVEDFKYFYIFFQKEAFGRGSDELCLLDKIYQGSVDYREKVSDELKANVYQALRILAEGLLKNPTNNLSVDSLQEIHDNSLVFLYRLLFTLYAEYRDLLPLDNSIYRDTYSLFALKNEIKEKITNREHLSPIKFSYWDHLKTLFGLLNLGSASFGIPERDFHVPPYNGGLFDPEKHEFLEKYRVGDSYLAQVVDLLSRSRDRAFVDYSSLEIRHLGSIYEGLLEYRLKMADEDMVAIKEKGKEKWISATKAKAGTKVFDTAEKGEVYLTTDKGERKATGSYYTPGYIVEYIIQNTLVPLVEEKKNKVDEKAKKLEEKYKASRGYNREVYKEELKKVKNSVIDEILSIKVLDPAMGSGHFLVEATDFLAHTLVRALSGALLTPSLEEAIAVKEAPSSYAEKEFDEEDIRWARREVIERCIFGVDLNPLAVELAKLSLWLSTVAKDRPLSFLDHHLRCGNSLIGARIDDLAVLPTPKRGKKQEVSQEQLALFDESAFKLDIGRAVKDFHFIEAEPSDNVKNVRKKEKIYDELRQVRLEKWEKLANLWASAYFGNELDRRLYQALMDKILGKDGQISDELATPYLGKAQEISAEKQFFHWEIEFPEVFFDEFGRRLENPGFDAVIGNPPYLNVKRGALVEYQEFLIPQFYLAQGQWDAFELFFEQSYRLLRKSGLWSFIIPKPSLSSENYEPLRNQWLEAGELVRVLDANMPFDDPGVEAIVAVVQKNFSRSNFRVEELSEAGRVRDVSRLSHNACISNPFKIISLRATEEQLRIFDALRKQSLPFGKIVELTRGIEAGKDAPFIFRKPASGLVRLGFGEDLERFSFKANYWAKTNDFDSSNFKPRGLYEQDEKLLIRRVGSSLISSVDKSKSHVLNTIYVAMKTVEEISLNYMSSVLNSKLINLWFHQMFVFEDRLFPYARISQLFHIPIRRISFVTSEAERHKLGDKGKELYKEFLSSNSAILNFVAKLIEKKHQPEPELVKKHNADPLNKGWQIPEGALWEQSDIVHDFLAYLAEQMIEMNKEKQTEIKDFLKWLEREIGAKIDDLTNKTIIKAYHEHSFDDLLEVLKQNRNKLQINLGSRTFQENLSSEVAKSVAKLTPLNSKIQCTDNLIDQIVYKLYGLTDEEIKLMEESK